MAAVAGEPVANPVLRAYADTVRACGIEPAHITAFMESMKMDTRVFRYETFRELEVYTYGSAAVVGLMMCRVVGADDRQADPHAEALGVAMQLSNFLRDVAEDWRRGRVYLPLEDLERFGYGEEDLAAGVVDGRLVALMRFEIERARKLYAYADEGIKYIPRGRRWPVMVARELYAGILGRIEARKLRRVLGAGGDLAAEKAPGGSKGGRARPARDPDPLYLPPLRGREPLPH
jgi:phytoene synthase